MSAITWNAQAKAAPLAASDVPMNFARGLGFGLGLILATASAYVGILLFVLMSASIIQF